MLASFLASIPLFIAPLAEQTPIWYEAPSPASCYPDVLEAPQSMPSIFLPPGFGVFHGQPTPSDDHLPERAA